MDNNDRQLLLKDLSAKLPYGVVVNICNRENTVRDVNLTEYNIVNIFKMPDGWWKEVKPYLRPMSSMTEEEREDFWFNVLDIDWRENLDIYDEEMETAPFPFVENGYGFYLDNYYISDTFAVIDWLNKHHFDFRNLIERGLAIKVTEENNPYKE